MCEVLEFFESPFGTTAVALPHASSAIVEGWTSLRIAMRKTIPGAFTRDEWAYLMTFLSEGNLRAPFVEAFGQPVSSNRATRLARPRGVVAVWLPNNVSLLGPLTLVLLSLTGNRILLKAGSRSQALTSKFLEFATAETRSKALLDQLTLRTRLEVFAHGDERESRMIENADVRIVFGSDEAAAAIHQGPHPISSTPFSFVNRQSQAWIEAGAETQETLKSLIRVFAIYGQMGCTSPRRVVLLNGSREQAAQLRDRLIELWPSVVRIRPPAHVASANTLALQWAAARDWDAAVTPDRGAVIGVGELALEAIDSPMFLPISPATLDEALRLLPENIQTIGHCLLDRDDPKWLRVASATKVKRLVPLGEMHHFGSVWDGYKFWSECFETVEVRL